MPAHRVALLTRLAQVYAPSLGLPKDPTLGFNPAAYAARRLAVAFANGEEERAGWEPVWGGPEQDPGGPFPAEHQDYSHDVLLCIRARAGAADLAAPASAADLPAWLGGSSPALWEDLAQAFLAHHCRVTLLPFLRGLVGHLHVHRTLTALHLRVPEVLELAADGHFRVTGQPEPAAFGFLYSDGLLEGEPPAHALSVLRALQLPPSAQRHFRCAGLQAALQRDPL